MRFKPALATLAAASLALAACSATTAGSAQPLDSAMFSAMTAAQEADKFTMIGDLTLYDSDSARTGCFPDGGYSDIGWGTDVVVTDDAGRTIAKGILDFGDADGPTCVFTFTVENVPGGSKFYGVEVSHRGAVTYTAFEARNHPSVALGN